MYQRTHKLRLFEDLINPNTVNEDFFWALYPFWDPRILTLHGLGSPSSYLSGSEVSRLWDKFNSRNSLDGDRFQPSNSLQNSPAMEIL